MHRIVRLLCQQLCLKGFIVSSQTRYLSRRLSKHSGAGPSLLEAGLWV